MGLTGAEIFLDSDDLRDLSKLRGHVRNSNVVCIVQSKEVLQRPYCLLELYTAIESQIPIIAVSIAGKGYDYAAASNFLLPGKFVFSASKKAAFRALLAKLRLQPPK